MDLEYSIVAMLVNSVITRFATKLRDVIQEESPSYISSIRRF